MSEVCDCTSNIREFACVAALAASLAADWVTTKREYTSDMRLPNVLAALCAVYFAAHTALAISEMSEAVTVAAGPAAMALLKSDISEAVIVTVFVPMAVAQTAEAISEMSEAVTVAAGPAAIALLKSLKSEAVNACATTAAECASDARDCVRSTAE